MVKTKTDNKAYMLLDRSGSMQSNWAETIGAVNAYVDGLKGDKATKETAVTVAAFDSQEPYKVMRDKMIASSWQPIGAHEVDPRGATPLFDAIGKLVTSIRSDAPKRATIVILTDGIENASQEITKDAAKAMLDDMRAKNYDVIFIGANFDAFSQGSSLGNNVGQTLNMSPGSYADAMKGLSSRTAAYTSTGSVANFSDDERKRAAGKR
jgi:uncharacterized protein with von Willebrand factor type A (vWA) domain